MVAFFLVTRRAKTNPQAAKARTALSNYELSTIGIREDLMSDWTSGYVADIGYTLGYFHELHPLRTNLVFLKAGHVPPERGVHCELGFRRPLARAPMRPLIAENPAVMGSDGVGTVKRVGGALEFAERLLATNPI